MKKIKFFDTKFKKIGNSYLASNDAGSFIIANKNQKDILKKESVEIDFENYLLKRGMAYYEENDFYFNSFKFKKIKRNHIKNKISYLIIIPTLRCNLSCSYCQVSRASETAKGFDWTNDLISKFENFVLNNTSENLKIEFQGGEPTLRLDLVKLIIKKITLIRPKTVFVICTNLQLINKDFRDLLKNPSVQISTSVDGPINLHDTQRINDKGKNNTFFKNLKYVVEQIGLDRLGALPTITDFKKIRDIINFYHNYGFSEIFLRQVNFQGFARKSHAEQSQADEEWIKTYLNSLEYIFEKNKINEKKILETNLSLHLNRIFKLGANGHVDLRSPNPAASDYLVIDYNGTFYPSDESRMLSRVGLIDLSIGNLNEGVDSNKVKQFNKMQNNNEYEFCRNCAYQPFCGVDVVDDLSRYHSVNHKKSETHFCKMRMSTFDYIFSKIVRKDKNSLENFSGHLTGDFQLNSIFAGSSYD